MNSNLWALGFVFALTCVSATEHTMCYNFFMAKDKCVFARAGEKLRCDAGPKPPAEVHQFTPGAAQKPLTKRSNRAVLMKRYDTDKNRPEVMPTPGMGVCKHFPPPKDGLEVCLWYGNSTAVDAPISSSGWLNNNKTSNCNKQVYIQRKGQKDTVQYALVRDGCTFNTTDPNLGCFAIGLSKKLYDNFNPTEKEIKQGYLEEITWDYNNLFGTNPAWGPV